MYFEITEARYKDSYKIDLRFEDGSAGTVNLQKYLRAGTVFEKLKEESLFKSLALPGFLWVKILKSCNLIPCKTSNCTQNYWEFRLRGALQVFRSA